MLRLETSDSDSRVFLPRLTSQRAEGAKWLRKAATDGHARARHNLAVAYHNGRGVMGDTTEAIRWYLMAAEQGVTLSQIAIRMMYLTGDGVDEQDDEAEEWFRMAAEEGGPLALGIVEMIEDYDPEDWEGVRVIGMDRNR